MSIQKEINNFKRNIKDLNNLDMNEKKDYLNNECKPLLEKMILEIESEDHLCQEMFDELVFNLRNQIKQIDQHLDELEG